MWREEHPDYGQKGLISGRSLQETIMRKVVDQVRESSTLALQETIPVQPSETVPENGFWVAGTLQDPM